MLDPDFLARFLACEDVPVDVRRWVLGLLHEAMTPSQRRRERDRWLRAAAALTPGARWTRARELHAMALEVASALPTTPDPHTVRGCVATAALLCPGRTPSAKTISRVLDKSV
jgi:hypothetical protein